MVPKKVYSIMFLVLAIASVFIASCSRSAPSPSGDVDKDNSPASVSTQLDKGTPQAEEIHYPEAYVITNKNHFDYQPGLECFAFASAYVLRHFGEEADGIELFEDFPGKLPGGADVYPSGVEQFWNGKKIM